MPCKAMALKLSGCTTTEAILVDDCTTLHRHMAARHQVIFILILFGYSNEFYRPYTGVGARSTISTPCFPKIQKHAALPSSKASAKPT